MNFAKVATDFYVHYNICTCATKHSISKAEVVSSVFEFLKKFPNSSHYGPIQHKLKDELFKRFYKSPLLPERFAQEYGMDGKTFRKIMREIIDDETIITSDSVADMLFRKFMAGTVLVSRFVPQRIVRLIAFLYTCESPYTLDGLASIYNTRRETISAILKRGISENIVDDVTAEKIVVRIHKYNKDVDCYDESFKQREAVKAQGQTQSET